MRSYGRVGQTNGVGGTWVEVTTDVDGFNDTVYLTTLVQCLKLNLGESPFFGNYGIPAVPSVITQVFPDYYAAQTQTQFSGFFPALAITRIQGSFPPAYTASVVCHNGAFVPITVVT